MVGKERKDLPLRPVILKIGVAFAFSLGGILYSVLRTRRNKPPQSKPSHGSPGYIDGEDSGGESCERKNCDGALQDFSLPKVSSHSSISDLSPNGRSIGNGDGYLLPEFDELVKECKICVSANDTSPMKNEEFLVPQVESPREHKHSENDDHDREISILRTKVQVLEERERNLEIKLLEYYGLKEQETAVMELHNRLRLNNVEAKLYNLKIDSLQSNNRKLEAQAADYVKVVAELETAKAKIKLLRKKLRSEAEQNREQILALQKRVMKLQGEERKADETDQDVENRLQKQRELEDELDEMKKLNQALKGENSDLAHKLDYLQMLATSALDNEEMKELYKDSQRLRQQNEDLTKQLEQLQADRCTDIEELVYLRWLNACLRYELRNYQPIPGKGIARDLSRTLSPKSEQRAKQLILEYANKEGPNDKGPDFDYDPWSSSQRSYLTDSGEPDDSSPDSPSADKTSHSGKPKVFSKLMRLLRRKDTPHHLNRSSSQSPLERAASMDDIVGRYSSDSHSCVSLAMEAGPECIGKTTRTSSAGSSSLSFDLQRSYSRGQKSTTGESSNGSRRTSDEGTLSIYRRMDSTTEDDTSPSTGLQPIQNARKIELLKYAEALKKSNARSSFRRRSASVSSF